MGKLRVDEYHVVTNRSRSNVNAHSHALLLEGRSESGPASQAVIYFWPRRLDDTVGYQGGSSLVGLLDDSDFRDWYDILRNEKPCYLYYTENGRSSENRLHHIGIGTSEEPVGEGPRDFTP